MRVSFPLIAAMLGMSMGGQPQRPWPGCKFHSVPIRKSQAERQAARSARRKAKALRRKQRAA